MYWAKRYRLLDHSGPPVTTVASMLAPDAERPAGFGPRAAFMSPLRSEEKKNRSGCFAHDGRITVFRPPAGRVPYATVGCGRWHPFARHTWHLPHRRLIFDNPPQSAKVAGCMTTRPQEHPGRLPGRLFPDLRASALSSGATSASLCRAAHPIRTRRFDSGEHESTSSPQRELALVPPTLPRVCAGLQTRPAGRRVRGR